MNDLQKCVFNLFCTFDHICKSLGITYYVMGGTMLGAARHQGFIPWDDDMDVGLLRRDYELFISKAAPLLPDSFFLQTYKTDPEYPLGITKLRDSRTTFIERLYDRLNMNHGVNLDIFPLDYYPENRREQISLERKRSVYKYRIRMALNLDGVHSSITEAAARAYGKLLMFRYPKVSDAVAERDRLYASIPQSGLIANYYGAWKNKEIVPADWYGEGTPLVFEGMTVTAPKEYDKWLTQVYGDYMQLPPPEKRKSDHKLDVIDLEKPYTVYVHTTGRKA